MITKKIKYYKYLLIILLSNVIYSQWCPPSIDDNNGVLSFDGTNDFVALPFIFDPNQDFTISFWFKRSDYGSSAKDLILSQADGDSPGETGRSIIAIGGQNGAIPKEIFLETNLTGSEKRLKQGVEINKWTHITLVHDTDGDDGIDKGKFYWYYNGIEHWDGDLIANNVDSNNDGEFYLGKNNSASQFFKGEIDELRIWNATRTFAQIQSDVHNIADTSDASLLAYYDMESISGGTLDNKSSSGATYNGTISGATATNGISNIVNSTSFAYGQVSYTLLEKDPTPTIIGLSGGTFSSSAGLTFISSSSGQIDVSASTPGSYTVTYTAVATSCSSPSSQFVTIVASNTMDLSYSCNTYNINSGVQSPTLGGGVPTGGYYYSEPKGLFLDKDTGQITTASSTIGDYEVYYSRSATTGTWTQIGSDIDAATGASGNIINQNRNGIGVRLNAAGNVLITESPGSDNNGNYSGQARVFYNNNGNWEQIGHNIGGENVQAATWHGDSSFQVDVNDKGDIIVMTNPLNDSSCSNCGRVIVLKLQNGIWSQLGNEFYGTAVSSGTFGLAVSLNAAGDVLAIGDQLNDDAGTNRGAISIYKYEGGSWVAKGSTIYPTQLGSTAHADNEKWGDAIDLNDAGDILIAGSSAWNSNQGMFKVFKYNGTTWNIYGEPKFGAAGSKYGHSVSVNATGNVISIGAHKYSSDKGRGYVFRLDETVSPNIWRNQQYGGALIDPNTERSFSYSQNTNELGTVNVMGSPNKGNSTGRNGEVSVWRGIHKDIGGGEIQPSQIQIGGYIQGEGANDRFGWSVDINDEGDIVAIGAPNNEQGGTDAGHVRVYRLVYDNDHKTRAPFNISIQDFDTTISYPASIYDQDDTPVTPTIATASGTFTVSPTQGINFDNEWGPSGAYFLSIDPTTGVVSPSVSLAGTYSITYTIGCESSTISMTIRSVNDIDHSLTYSPTTVCISGGGNLTPTIIPTTSHSTVPRVYLDPGNIASYPDVGNVVDYGAITNLTTNSAYNHWSGNQTNNANDHPDFRTRINATGMTHIPGYSWKINDTHKGNSINNSGGGSLRYFFPRYDFSVSVWVKGENWSDGYHIFDWANGDMNNGQVELWYTVADGFVIQIHNTNYTQMGDDFIPSNNQWYNLLITRNQFGPGEGENGILKFYVNGELKNTRFGVDNRTLDDRGDIHFGRNQQGVNNTNSTQAFLGEIGVIKIFEDVLSPSEVEYEFDSFAPRYLPDSFTSTPAGLSIDASTGIIDVASSNAGTYSVTTSWEEPIAETLHTGQTSITIEEDDVTSISYPDNAYCNLTLGTVTPTITGVSTGTFTSTPGGLSIDASTGIITPASSSLATYTILFTTAGLCSTTASYTLAINNTEGDASFNYPENAYNQSDIGIISPSITQTGGSFTVTPTYGLIHYPNQWGPSGAYYLSIDPTTGAVSPSASLAGTYSITYSVECASSTISMKIRSVNDIDHSLTYSPTTVCISEGGNLTPTIIPNNQNVIPRLYFDPGNPLSYTPSSTDIINLTTDSSFSNWYSNEVNNTDHHPDYLVHGTELTYNKWHSWSIPGIPAGSIVEPASNIFNSFIGSYTTGSILRRSFPQGSMTVSVWVKESDWTNDTFILDHGVSPSWGNEWGQFSFYYQDSTPKVRIKNSVYTLGDFLPNNDQWYHIALIRETYGGLNIGATGILKLYVNGQIKHVEYGVTNTQTSGVDGNNNAKGTTSWFRNKNGLASVDGWGAFDGEAGVVRLFDAPLSTNEIQREFDMFAPRYLTDSFTPSPVGLSIDSNTGIIDVASSNAGTYSVTLSWNEPIAATPHSAQTSITIEEGDVSSISYPDDSYCVAVTGTVTPTITGVSSGTFTSSPTGLIIDSSTGIITPELSSVATYTILFTTAGLCSTTASFTLAITDKENTSFNYPKISYCQVTIGSVTPTITGNSSGTFTSSPTGLIIDPLTGIITPEGSSVATYTIEYTTPGDCSVTTSFTLIITDFEEDATFKYTASSYCINDMSIITPIISNPGGNISSSPPGLSIDLTNGEITPSLSLTGTYTIEYTTPGECPSTSSTTVIINDLDDPTFIYSSNLFCTNETSVATPTITTLGGTFTSSPTGLFIDLLTGVISPGASLAGTYSVTYTTPITKNLSYSIPQKDNLIGHYPLDDNHEDVSGKSYHGTVTSTSNPIGADNRFGNPFSALEFDGDDSIYFGDEMLDEFNGSTRNSFTISVWLKYNTTTLRNFMSLGQYGCNDNDRGVVFRTAGNNNSQFTGCNKRGKIDGNYADNAWHHFVFKYDKDIGRSVYIDGAHKGVEIDSETNLHNIITYGLTIGGGYQHNVTVSAFIGYIDDVKIWNTPLTEEEILNLYNDESTPPAIPALGPITLGCVSSKTISITISEKASGTFSYPHEDISFDAEFCSLDADITPTVISTVSGTFSSSPDGLHLDPFTGEIKFNLSSDGNYNISYEMPSDCGSTIISTTLVIKNCEDEDDSDGDGVPDVTEILPPETDPFNGCDYYFLHQHPEEVSPEWAALDCDGDGVTNGNELKDNTDPTNPCSFKKESITLPITAIGLDCDGDGVPGYKEEAEDNTDSVNSCSLIVGNISLIVSSIEDCDGDGVTNADEGSDKTNPLDGCSFLLSRSGKSKTKAWEALDCDGDGVLNGNEDRDGTDVFNNCSYILSSMTIYPTKGFDCDGDGVTNWQEVRSFTDPTDGCDLDPLTIDFEISKEWFDTDCDGDTYKNSIDVFPFYKLEWFDTDNDLVGNNKDQDDDNDGILDIEEGDDDLDNDGNPNYLDTDSDGDGCPDAIEAGYNDQDNNGILGSGDVQVDSDGKILSNGGYSQISDNDSNNIYDYLEFGSKVDIITNPNKTYEIYRQSSIEISVTAEAKSTISYQWQLNKNGASISSKSNGWEDINDSQDYVGTKTNILTILNPQFSMEGWNFRLVTSSPCYVCGGQTISEPAELIISKLFIPNAFSPDGDGINDTWTIRGGLYNYPNNNLVVFNRWGLKVYEADGYNNNWDGTNKGNTNSGNDSKLPVGTYFYVLDLNGNGKNVKKGFIYLTRLNE